MYWHYFSDGANKIRSIAGGVGMLAGGIVIPVCQRAPQTCPDSMTIEVVSGGNNLHHLIPITGLLQEFHIQQGKPVPFYMDSSTSLFVAKDESSAKRSLWIRRRIAVLQEGVEYMEINPLYIPGEKMVADAFTKYLTRKQWEFLMSYILNLDTPQG